MDARLQPLVDRFAVLDIPYRVLDAPFHGVRVFPADNGVGIHVRASEDPRIAARLSVILGLHCPPTRPTRLAMLSRQRECPVAKIGTVDDDVTAVVDLRADPTDDEIRVALFGLATAALDWAAPVAEILGAQPVVTVVPDPPQKTAARAWAPAALVAADSLASRERSIADLEDLTGSAIGNGLRLVVNGDSNAAGAAFGVRLRSLPEDDRLAELLSLNHALPWARLEVGEGDRSLWVTGWLPAAGLSPEGVGAALGLLKDAVALVLERLEEILRPFVWDAGASADGSPLFGEYAAGDVPYRVRRPHDTRRLAVIERWRADVGWRVVRVLPKDARPVHGARPAEQVLAFNESPAPAELGFDDWHELLERLREPLIGAINGLLTDYDVEWHFSNGASDWKYNREAMDAAKRALALLADIDDAVMSVREAYHDVTGGDAKHASCPEVPMYRAEIRQRGRPTRPVTGRIKAARERAARRETCRRPSRRGSPPDR